MTLDDTQLPTTPAHAAASRLTVPAGAGTRAVYEAGEPELDRSIAPTLLPGAVRREDLRQRLVREIQALAQLQHPSVVGVMAPLDGRHDIDAVLVDGVSRWTDATAVQPTRCLPSLAE